MNRLEAYHSNLRSFDLAISERDGTPRYWVTRTYDESPDNVQVLCMTDDLTEAETVFAHLIMNPEL